MTQRHTTRRDFLQLTAASSAVVATPYFVPSGVLGRQAVKPSERLTIGCIGTGGRGRALLNSFLNEKDCQVLAVCDVDSAHLQMGKQVVDKRSGNADCSTYNDFRELLAREDLDAVIVATPDHWHALASVAAARANKDIYCEKPLANSVGEGRAICEAVKKNNRILQTGSHERSRSNCRLAGELVRNGRLGKVHTVRINMPTDQGHHNQVKAMREVPGTMKVPDGFDYNFWLGHTPEVPYTPRRCHFWWRFILAYGGGEMTDRGAHIIDIAQLGLGTDETGPVKFEAQGWNNQNGLYDACMDYQFTNTYQNGVRLIGSTRGPRGLKFEGTDGSLFVHIHGGKLTAQPAALLKETAQESRVSLGRSPGHARNFLDCIKSRQEPLASAEVGHRTATICHLNNIAMKLGRPLNWDPKAERVIGDDEANALLMPNMREPWTL